MRRLWLDDERRRETGEGLWHKDKRKERQNDV
jgi:hypothetical protein